MSSLLSSYESDFKTTFEQAISSIQIAPNQPLPQRNSTLKEIEEQKDELLDLVDQMEIEINTSVTNPNDRANYKSKLRDFKKDVQEKIKQPLQKLVDLKDRDLLFGDTTLDGVDGEEGSYENEQQRLSLIHI